MPVSQMEFYRFSCGIHQLLGTVLVAKYPDLCKAQALVRVIRSHVDNIVGVFRIPVDSAKEGLQNPGLDVRQSDRQQLATIPKVLYPLAEPR